MWECPPHGFVRASRDTSSFPKKVIIKLRYIIICLCVSVTSGVNQCDIYASSEDVLDTIIINMFCLR